jgi:hypothetical protein
MGELHSFLLDFFVTTGMEPAKIYISGDLFASFLSTQNPGALLINAEKGKEYTPKLLTQFGYLPIYPKNVAGLMGTVIIDMDEAAVNKAVEKMLRGED